MFVIHYVCFPGTGIYKTSSSLNHSCVPNCIAMFNGTEICIRAISNICPGDELYVSYVNLLDTKYNRQLELKEGYMFQCQCSLCNHSSYNDFLMKSLKCDECQPCPCIQPMSPDIVLTNEQKKSYKQYFGGSKSSLFTFSFKTNFLYKINIFLQKFDKFTPGYFC